MSRKLLLLGAVLIAAVAALFVVALLNVDSLVARYRPELEKRAGTLLKSKVTIEKLETSIIPKTRIRILDLKIAPAEASAGSGELTLHNLYLDVKLLPLLRKKLEITRLELDRPTLAFIRDGNGVYLEGLPPAPKTEGPGPAAPAGAAGPGEPSADGRSAFSLDLKSVAITNATLSYKDRIQGREYQLSDCNAAAGAAMQGRDLKVTDFRLSGRMLERTIEVGAPLLTFAGNVLTADELQIRFPGGGVRLNAAFNLNDLTGRAHLYSDSVDLHPLISFASEFSPALAAYGLKGRLKPDLTATLELPLYKVNGRVGLEDLALTSGNLALNELRGLLTVATDPSSSRIAAENLVLKLNGEPVSIQPEVVLQGKQLRADRLLLGLLGGEARLKGRLALEQPKTFGTTFEVNGIDLSRALASAKSPLAERLAGTLQTLHGELAGDLSGAAAAGLKGKANLLIANGELRDINIAGAVFKAVKDLPFLQGSLYSAASDSDRAALDASGTPIKTLSGNLVIANGKISSADLKLESHLFSLQADGWIGFDRSVDLNATAYFDPVFSQRLAANRKELRNLLTADGRLIIPLTLKGQLPGVLVLPNIQKLLETSGGRMLQEKAGKALDELLEKKGGKGLGRILGGF